MGLLPIPIENLFKHLLRGQKGLIVGIGDFDHLEEKIEAMIRALSLLVNVPFEHVCALRVAWARWLDRGVHISLLELRTISIQFQVIARKILMLDLLP